MGDWIWLTRGDSCQCFIIGLPEGKGFALNLADEARRFGAFPWAGIAARAAALRRGGPFNPPALARQAVALADDEDGKLRLAARRTGAIDIAEHDAQGPHLGA